jgi:hypothetical protein
LAIDHLFGPSSCPSCHGSGYVDEDCDCDGGKITTSVKKTRYVPCYNAGCNGGKIKSLIKCDKCGGMHKWSCTRCHGTGTYCRECNTEGRVTCKNPECKKGKIITKCTNCGGTGLFNKVKCEFCNNGKVETECLDCQGTGKITCPDCLGTMTCYVCRGDREVVCSSCNEEGQKESESVCPLCNESPKGVAEEYEETVTIDCDQCGGTGRIKIVCEHHALYM